ncbi:hypothetical protein L9F63_011067, partial [Diploptera punctata]
HWEQAIVCMDSSCHGEYRGLSSHSMDKSPLYNELLQPEPLGSITHNQEIDGSTTSLQIRSSARVSKKMRLDSIATPVATVVLDKIDRKDLMKETGKSEKSEKSEKPDKHEKQDKHDKAEAKQNESKTKKRPVEVWSQDDKNTFFEALNEYGKDFDLIQSNFVAKAKKKGLAEHLIKNKEQIRLFYYRTWHKISKYLKFNGICSSEIKNAVKEVYGLINYGEIRKRVGYCTEKIICTKLNELVYRGSIQLRTRGKTLRIKTPICKALRRLNRIEDHEELMKLPARVTVELRPRTTDAWARVQSAAQNPRIRALLPLQKRLSSLLVYLSQRWCPSNLKHHEIYERARKQKKEKEALLRVAPLPDAKICLPTVNLTEYLTSSRVCLTSYHERFQTWLADGSAFQILWKPPSKGSSRKGGKRQRMNSASDKKTQSAAAKMAPPKQKENVSPEIEFVNCGVTLNSASDNNVICRNGNKDQKHCPDDGASCSTAPPQDIKMEVDSKPDISAQSVVEPVPKVEETKDTISRIRTGWTVEDANAISIGELYLMFGSESKLRLEYWWENAPPDPGTVPAPVPVQNVPGTSEKETKVETSTNRIAETLQKLINIARLNYRKAKVVCPCGHICGGSNKQSANARRTQPIRALIENGLNAKPVHPRVSVSVTSLQDGVFRRPLLAPSQFKPPPKQPVTSPDAFKAQLDKFRPKYCNRRGRTVRSKNVVVQRMLPLLPKAPNGHAIMTLKVIPQSSQVSGEFLPIGTTVPPPLLSRQSKHHHILPATSSKKNSGCIMVPSTSTGALPDLNQDITPMTQTPGSTSTSGTSNSNIGLHKASTSTSSCSIGLHQSVENTTTSGLHQPGSSNLGLHKVVTLVQNTDSLNLHEVLGTSTGSTSGSTQALRSSSPSLNTPVASPPSISNLLELSLPSTVGEELATIATGTGNGLLDHSTAQPSFEGLLPTEGTLQNSGTPPTSPSRILKEADNQWLNSEVADFSLSSFLGHLDSPLKPAASTAPTEDTRLYSDVEAQLQCLMSENSVDYMAKFADLAAQIASSDASNKK